MQVGSRFYNDIVFQLPVITIEFNVNAGVDLFIENCIVGRDVGTPLLWVVADEIVNFDILLIYRNYLRVFVGIDEGEFDEFGGNSPCVISTLSLSK